MNPLTLPQSFNFTVPTAFYPGFGTDISHLPALLEKGVKIFVHCDNTGLPSDKYPQSILFDLNEEDSLQVLPNPSQEADYQNNLLETIRRLRELDYEPKIVEQGNLFYEMGGIEVVHKLHHALHAMPDTEMEKEMLMHLPAIWFCNHHLLKVHDPKSKEPFVILMMNAEALCILKFLFETQCPDYLTFGRVSGVNLEHLHWTLESIALIYGSSMPVIHAPKNLPNQKNWEGYEYDHYNDALIPNPEILGPPANPASKSERTVQFSLIPEIRETFLNLKMRMIQALNLENTLPWFSTGHPIQMPLPKLTKAQLDESKTNFESIIELYFSKRSENKLNKLWFKMNTIDKGLFALQRWSDNATEEIVRENSIAKVANICCDRYYLPSTKLTGEQYSIAGSVYETRIVTNNYFLTNHSAEPGIIQNLESLLRGVSRELQLMGNTTKFNDTIQEFLNLSNDLSIHVFPLTHHYRSNLRKIIKGFSAVVQFICPNGTRIAEVSYLNDRVCGCVRMYDASNNLAGELFVRMGSITKYNCFLDPKK